MDPAELQREWKARLRREWHALLKDDLTSAEKGKGLESFAASLFGTVFKIADRNVRTRTEELDIVLEYEGTDPVWSLCPTALVECKHWSSKAPQKELSAFATKAELKAIGLSFFVSPSGFTKDAQLQATYVCDAHRLLVLLDGEDITDFLKSAETTDAFLKRARRNALLRRPK